MRVIHVLRKPFCKAEGSVASNVLKHGCGGINIDAARVASLPGETVSTHSQGSESVVRDDKVYGKYAGNRGTEQTKGQTLGRWPANLILQHKEGCVQEGTRQVRGSHDTTGVWGHSKPGGWANPEKRDKGYTDAEGKETVPNWICEPDCPVRALDAGTKDLAKQGSSKIKDTGGNSFLGTGFGGQHQPSMGTREGSPVFFKQVK